MKKHSLALILVLAFILAQNEAAPGKSSGNNGGGSKGSSIGKIFGGSSSSKAGGSSGGGGGKKSKLSSKLKKAAIIGVGAYGAYQVGKLAAKAATWPFRAFTFNDWNSWREVDGLMCRNNNDCTWIDRQLYCQDYELEFTPSAAWFGGDVLSIQGECSCPQGTIWDNRELTCQVPQFSAGLGIAAIAGIIIAILFMCCCCCGGIFLCRKFMSS